MELKIFKNKQEVAEDFSKHLQQLINGDQPVHIALSGGSTPKAIFDYMAEKFGNDINWGNAHLYWGDERCVPPTDGESNYKMTVDHLLSKIDFPESNIHRVLGEDDPKTEAIRYGKILSENLSSSNGIPQFDLVILGMGDDGHTASVFPFQMELWDSENNCEVAQHPESGQNRVTITGKVINEAKEVAFLVTGGGKKEKVEEIIGKKGSYQSYPASRVAPVSGNLSWYLDEAAAAGIK